MATMTNQEIAQSYYNRLLTSNDIITELSNIISEINSLVRSTDSTPISKTHKLEIINQLKTLIESGDTRFDSITEVSLENRGFDTEASDNSGTIDIIGILTSGIK